MLKPGVHRSPWRDFPDVVIQTTVHKLRSRPAYEQSKRGAGQAAFEVVQQLVKLEKIPFAFDTVVPVMQFDRDKPNALPLVYAAALAKHFDAYLETGIHQINVVSHTFADAQTRILGQPMFIGKIQPSSRVLIVDDVVTYGSTLANLRGWIHQQDATVVGATTLAAGFGGTKLALPDMVRDRLLDRFSNQAEALAKELGFSAECFTNREARFLAGLKTEHEMQRLIVAAQELNLLQERQLSLEQSNQIDPPSQP
jgi:hypoxanthine phosphoribosyltransferase